MQPTRSQFTAYSDAYDYFNEKLFGSTLPRCLLNFSRKDKRVRGFFSPNRWECGEDESHEISLNPDLLKRPFGDVMSTLVHEMCHLWQQEYGTPSRNTYHNWQFAEKMEKVGLVTSDTGEPGGRRVGQQMTHYIAGGGPFVVAFDAMPESCKLPWISGNNLAAKKAPIKESKIKYTCPECHQNAWGKPGLLILCASCDDGAGSNVPMISGLPLISQPEVLEDCNTFMSFLLS